MISSAAAESPRGTSRPSVAAAERYKSAALSRPAPRSRRCRLKPLLQAIAEKATPKALEADTKPKPPALILSIDQRRVVPRRGAGRSAAVSCLAARPADRKRACRHRRLHHPLRQLRTPAARREFSGTAPRGL